MTFISPDLDIIKGFHPRPTDIELSIINLFKDLVDDNLELYYKPWINGDNPDFVLLKKNYYIYIIQIIGIEPQRANFLSKTRWVDNNNITILSQIVRIKYYRENLIESHLKDMPSNCLKKPAYYGIIKSLIILLRDKQIFEKKIISIDEHALDFLKICDLKYLMNFIQSLKQKKSDPLFSDELYDEIRRYLQPTFHQSSNQQFIIFGEKQTKLINSDSKSIKIKGVAGSGKTFILVNKAINLAQKTSGKILILTFNITLRNYIREIFSEHSMRFDGHRFLIIHIHEFLYSQLYNHSVAFDNSPNDVLADPNLFEKVAYKINKYDAILIDEIQDFEKNWIDLIRKYFLKPDGYFIVFADEKQNIYRRLLDSEKKPYTSIPGQWNKLEKSYRVSPMISDISKYFQTVYFSKKYEIDFDFEVAEKNLFYNSKFLYLNKVGQKYCPLEFSELVINEITNQKLHPNDIAIIAGEITLLSELDFHFRIKLNEKTETNFETYEEYVLSVFRSIINYYSDFPNKKEVVSLLNNSYLTELAENLVKYRFTLLYNYNLIKDGELESDRIASLKLLNETLDYFEREKYSEIINNFYLRSIRKNKKVHFVSNPGTMKLCTLHSFKGFESSSVFLLLANSRFINSSRKWSSLINDEFVYTAITRAQRNLYVINYSFPEYDAFFSEFQKKYNT